MRRGGRVTLDSKQLIDQVNGCRKNDWQNSDIGKKSEEMLVLIAEHFEICEECREDFDFQEFPEKTLIEFEYRLNGTDLSDWICEGEQ